MLVSDVISILKKIAPTELAEEWDNVGLILGNPTTKINNVLVALDCTKACIKNAIENNCNLIITHHPVIFNPLNKIDYSSFLSFAIKNDIAVYSMHTNMDNCEKSMNVYIANKLGAKEIKRWTSGILFEIKQITVKNLADRLKIILSDETYKIKGNLNDSISKVYLSTGSGLNRDAFEACKAVADICISSEIKHNFYVEDDNVKLLEFSHFNSELPFEKIICDILKDVGIKAIKNSTTKPYIEY